ncbi:VOC family protein [Denitrobaculum tricleocarpae]|uniref:Glyoxalase n=1 Tax=Denitrobaculum tricleocarpae TaxID=2591009 RepID=A0A545TYK7_9PROT|nr:VOC family protein [Denitrobaculum tricleocarpae]TQV82305.1 glyoxalase [Denitrobaculum tricleocarpae]
MPLTSLDHVNIRTRNLPEMVRFYEEVVGLYEGERPPFSFPGAWLYCGDRAALHLMGPAEGETAAVGQIDHFAFMASGLSDFIANLEKRNIEYATRTIPELGNTQVNVRDPDGNRIEIQFLASESA